jgi:hypothetical protein
MTNNNYPPRSRHDGVFESERAGKTPQPVKHAASDTMRSPDPAGGEIPRSRYAGKVPQPAPPPPRDPGTTNDIPEHRIPEHWRR